MQETETKFLRMAEAQLAVLNHRPIPDHPAERKSLEGCKQGYRDRIRQSQEVIQRIPKLIEEAREAQLKLPVILEWAKAP